MQDAVNARIDQLEGQIRHHNELDQEQVAAIKQELAAVKEALRDHEGRLRTNTEGVTTFKVWSGLGTGGASLISIISFIRSFLP
jgi:hypothetical protein